MQSMLNWLGCQVLWPHPLNKILSANSLLRYVFDSLWKWFLHFILIPVLKVVLSYATGFSNGKINSNYQLPRYSVFSKGSVLLCSFSNSLLYTNKEILISSMPKILLGKTVSKSNTFHLPAIYTFIPQLGFFFFPQSIKSQIPAFSLYVKAIDISNKGIMDHFRYPFERRSSSSLQFSWFRRTVQDN